MKRSIWILLSLLLGAAAGAAAPPRAARGISQISIERTPCFGSCPVDTVTLRADGTATYLGTRFVEKLGTYQGRFSPEELTKIGSLLRAGRFSELKDRYAIGATDLPSTIVTVTQGGNTKRVVDYGGAGPDELWWVQQALLGVASRIRWEKAPAAEGAPAARGDSGIHGVAMAGPVRPVQRPGEVNSRPLPRAVIVVHREQGGAEVARTTADGSGRFRLELRPAAYKLAGLPPTPGARYPRGSTQSVTVPKGRWVEVTVSYDTGIR